MTHYKVTKTYTYTETVIVEASCRSDAEGIAIYSEGDINNDDTLFDVEAVEVEEE